METQEILEAVRGWLETVALVPASLEAYAPLVVDGLLFFVGRLPAARLDAIVASQLALPDDARADDRLVALVRECPTLHKLGQVIARQAGLPLDLRTRLATLESLAPPPGNRGIDALVEREVGAVAGLTVARDALAEGSVAFVVPFELQTRGPNPEVRRGVFKALKPDAAERLGEDLGIWPELGDYLERRSADLGLAAPGFRALLDGVAGLLQSEIRLDSEQLQLARARRFYADSPQVVIPELFAFCTPALTAMERIDGVKVTDPGVPAATRRSLAQTIVDALLAKPFWSAPATQPFFHADPHAGNLFATADGKLAVFDWALTTCLTEAQSAAVVQVLASAVVLDEAGVSRALGALGTIGRGDELARTVARAVGAVRRGTFPGFAWLTPLLDELGRSGALTFPESTALFRKSLLTLAGVVHDVWPNASVDGLLLASGGRQFAAESLPRLFAPADSRAFGTHLSNDDLVRFIGSSGWTATRYVLGAYRDALDTLTRR